MNLTADLIERIATLIRAGNEPDVSAAAAGVDPDTFADWLQQGVENADSLAGDLCAQIRRAEAEREAALVARVTKAAQNGSWGAAAWLLERLTPERWAKPSDRSKIAADSRDAEPSDPFAALDELAPRRANRSPAA